MRMSLWLRCASIALVFGASSIHAQNYRSMSTSTPRVSSQQYSPAPPLASSPGCETPVVPYLGTPSAVPAVPGSAPTTTPASPTSPTSPATPGGTAPSAPTTPTPSPTPAMSTGAAESRGESGSDALASAAPQMIGDLIGIGINRCGIAVNRGGVKIAENESPLPLDRGFVTFNYFNNVGTTGLVNGAGSSPNLYRGLVGFEKTFLDGQASFGMRLPFNQSDGLPGGDGFGDLSVIMKYAFYNCPDTGRVLSGGLAVAIPTGLSLGIPGGGSLNNVLLQPWGGFICPFGDFYGHGFTSVIVPTQNRDITLYTADVGVGYRLYQCGSDNFLRAVIPTIEGHANIPLGGSCRTGQVYFPDLISVTGGVHFGLGSACWFTVAGNVPLTGPRLYDFEALAQLNVRF